MIFQAELTSNFIGRKVDGEKITFALVTACRGKSQGEQDAIFNSFIINEMPAYTDKYGKDYSVQLWNASATRAIIELRDDLTKPE